MFKENKEEFRKWLIEDRKLSRRAAGDILSRCKRLDNTVLDSLQISVSSPESYLIALKEIRDYAVIDKQAIKSQYALTATLRAAMKKYCEYMNPQTFEQYPDAYSLIRLEPSKQ